MKSILRLQFVILLLLITSCTAYAFASSSTGGTIQAGEGVNSISGWAVSNVRYHPAEDPSRLSSVEFDLDKPAGVVKVGFDSSGSMYFECANTVSTHWICDVQSRVEIRSLNELRIIGLGGK